MPGSEGRLRQGLNGRGERDDTGWTLARPTCLVMVAERCRVVISEDKKNVLTYIDILPARKNTRRALLFLRSRW